MILKHGHSAHGKISREYRCWLAMRERCNNINSYHYKYYGARGIKVCAEWDKFDRFLADMGPRPIGTSIDRIDNNGNYEPQNCRWATPAQQRRNTRRTVVINGQTIKDWTNYLGSKRGLVGSRLKRGWSKDRAISVPIASRLNDIDRERARDLLLCTNLTYKELSKYLGISVGSLWRFGSDLRQQQQSVK